LGLGPVEPFDPLAGGGGDPDDAGGGGAGFDGPGAGGGPGSGFAGGGAGGGSLGGGDAVVLVVSPLTSILPHMPWNVFPSLSTLPWCLQ
jgi:hypothetical protein